MMQTTNEFEDFDLEPTLYAGASKIAITYGIADDMAVYEMVAELAVGNDEPDIDCDLDDNMNGCPLHSTHFALDNGLGFFEIMPPAHEPFTPVTMAVLAGALENTHVDELRRIRDALNGSAGIIALAKPRKSKLKDPRQALLEARVATIKQFWADWKNLDAFDDVEEVEHELNVAPGTGAAFALDCLAEADCGYAIDEIVAVLR